MPNQDKLIKSGIKYTDAVFDEIIQRLSRGVKSTDTLEAFLEKTKDYTLSNPLQVSGYKDGLLKIILQETNSHKFSRPAQKELVRITIENRVGELIDNVGEDIKDSVRDIVKDGYNNQLSQDEIAENISSKVTSIKNRRARAIARTEIARTATVSDYVINRERGANGWYVECRNTACPVCKDRWHKSWTPENDESFKPSDTSAGGKGWIGDRIFSMNDTSMLPPVHPSCRCVVYYTSEEPNVSTEPVQQTTSTTVEEPLTTEITSTVTSKKTNPKYSKLAKDYDYIEFTNETDEFYVYHNIIDNCDIQFEKNTEISEIKNCLKIYDSMDWVLKRNTPDIRFITTPNDKKKKTGGLNHDGIYVEIFLGNIKRIEHHSGVPFVVAHELAHSIDFHSKTSFTGKKFSSKRIWQKAISDDDKNFKAQGISAYYGSKNPIEHSPTAGSNVTWELFFGTEDTLAMEDIADAIGVQFMRDGERLPTDIGNLTKDEWNEAFPNRAKLAQDILKNPIKYGLDNSLMLGNYGETNTKKEPQSKPTSEDNNSKIEKLNRRIKSYEKSIKKFSKIDKKIAKMYEERLAKAQKELSKLQGA